MEVSLLVVSAAVTVIVVEVAVVSVPLLHRGGDEKQTCDGKRSVKPCIMPPVLFICCCGRLSGRQGDDKVDW